MKGDIDSGPGSKIDEIARRPDMRSAAALHAAKNSEPNAGLPAWHFPLLVDSGEERGIFSTSAVHIRIRESFVR